MLLTLRLLLCNALLHRERPGEIKGLLWMPEPTGPIHPEAITRNMPATSFARRFGLGRD